MGLDKIELVEAITYSGAIAGGGALLTIPFIPKIKKIVDKKFRSSRREWNRFGEYRKYKN